MKILGFYTIGFGEHIITEKELEFDRKRWYKKAIMPSIFHSKMDSITLLRAMLYEGVPLTIDVTDGTSFRICMEEFPYVIHTTEKGVQIRTQHGFATFAIRMMPMDNSGKITKVSLDRESHVAINSLVVQDEKVQAELGNGALNFELFYEWDEDAFNTPLKPYKGYKKEVTLRLEDAID